MTAATLVDTATSTWTDTAVGTEVAPGFSWILGDVLVVMGVTEDTNNTLATPTVVNGSGTGLTFAAVGSAVTASNEAWAHTWVAVAGGTGSGDISSAANAGTAMRGIWVDQYRGTSGANGLGTRATEVNVTDQVVSLNRTGDDSSVMYIAADWNAVGVTSLAWTPSGQTQVQGLAHTNVTAVAARWGGQGAAGATNYGTSGLTGTRSWTRIALEVLGSAGGPISVNANRVTSTEVARTLVATKAATLSRVTETHTARTLTSSKSVAIGRATETHTARTAVARKAAGLARVVSTETARTVTSAKVLPALSRATETSTARTVGRLKTAILLGRAGDVAEARTLSVQGDLVVNANRVSETHLARTLTRAKAATLTRVLTTDSPRALGRTKTRLLVRASTTETARTVSRLKVYPLGRVGDLGTARTVTASGPVPSGWYEIWGVDMGLE